MSIRSINFHGTSVHYKVSDSSNTSTFDNSLIEDQNPSNLSHGVTHSARCLKSSFYRARKIASASFIVRFLP